MFLVQHGWGTGSGSTNRILRAIRSGDADGVIWSASEWVDSTLTREIKSLGQVEQMLDPQVYAAYAPPPLALKRLMDYDWINVLWSVRSRKQVTGTLIQDVVARALQFQLDQAGLTVVTAPSMALTAATGASLAAVQRYASDSIAWWSANGDDRPLYLSLPVTERVLDADASIHALMGALRRTKANGIYLLLELNPNTDPTAYASRFARALWLAHRLVAADFRVRVGYAGLSGFLFRAAHAEATAAGWYQNRRWWTLAHWRARSGGAWTGRTALDTVMALLEPNELAAIRDADPSVFGRLTAGVGPLAAALRRSPARAGRPVTHEEETAQYFAVCGALDRGLGAGFAVDGPQAKARIEGARALRTAVARAAVTIGSNAATDSRIDEWETALVRLGARLGVSL